MVAYVVVLPTPYSAVVDRAGRFRMAGVPPGRYLVRVWHRRLKPYEQGVVVPDGALLRLDLDLGRWRRAGR